MFGRPQKKFGKEILPNLFHFSEGQMLDCNMYILKDSSNHLCLIDAGNGLSMDPLITAATELGLSFENLTHVVITHEHLDHVLGLYRLKEIFGDKFQIFAHPVTAGILIEGDEDKIAPRSLGISAQHFGVKITPLSATPLKEGEHFEFGSFKFDILDTPGHSLGSNTYYDANQKILFPGDVVFPQGSFGRYDFPGGSLSVLKNSIDRINKLEIEYLCSGHMPPVIGNAGASVKLSHRNIMSMRW